MTASSPSRRKQAVPRICSTCNGCERREARRKRPAGSAAAGVVAARRARVATARALHHPAALLAGGTELEAGHLRRDDRRGFGEGARGGDRLAAGRLRLLGAVATLGVAVAAVARTGGV